MTESGPEREHTVESDDEVVEQSADLDELMRNAGVIELPDQVGGTHETDPKAAYNEIIAAQVANASKSVARPAAKSWQIIHEQAYKLGQIEGVLLGHYSDAEKVRKIRRLLGMGEPQWLDSGTGPGWPDDGTAWERHDDPEQQP